MENSGVDFRSNLEKALSKPSAKLELTDSASVALIFKPGPDMLWIRRAENPNDPWSGHMGFPGGRSEPGDSNTRRTAERETLEEIGLELPSCSDHLGTLDEVQVRNRFGVQPFKLVPHIFWLHGAAECTIDPHEVHSVHWIQLVHFFDPANRTTFGTYPGYRYADRVIWGLSYRVLTDLLTRLESANFPKMG